MLPPTAVVCHLVPPAMTGAASDSAPRLARPLIGWIGFLSGVFSRHRRPWSEVSWSTGPDGGSATNPVMAPRSEMLAGIVERADKGFILTGPDLPRDERGVRGWPLERDPFLFETNVPGIFAAGDVRAGASRRVAAAVGEGSASIYSVHKYLETV